MAGSTSWVLLAGFLLILTMAGPAVAQRCATVTTRNTEQNGKQSGQKNGQESEEKNEKEPEKENGQTMTICCDNSGNCYSK
ncbi:MAG: hypothetical protein ACKOYK_08035 [Cyanobium sp.]